ncbi:BFD-like [2Fe-2S] binding domain-containing protein [Thalassobacillus cyri]|uniref:BFD-like [2Fe-2S] binding domain-containing protein n=1 Tax=Thalassobacillus cyri TaxID=571932 RepID=A0A1H3VZL1_9BACI|nr:(2Fe-2S)-binding protein [Thalassobacillus cyri]SDZ80236.1 BFD-like [2Fe-2S] binding domain-containing protein [Thalassobacillus cyri]
MDKSTIVCRCEEINVDEIETVLKMGAETFDDVKRITRCGMGPCQAKMCVKHVSNLISEYTGKPLAEIPPARARMPLKITRMRVLAGTESHASTVKAVFEEGDPDEK